MSRTKNYAIQTAAKMQKQLNTVAADLYGGANDVTLGAGSLMQVTECIMDDGTEVIVNQDINGTQTPNYQDTVAKVPTVEVSTTVHSAGDLPFIVSALGWENLDGPKSNGTNYTHLIPLQIRGKEQRAYTAAEEALVVSGFDADDRINPYIHIARELGPSVEHAKNVVFKGIEIGSQQKQELKMKLAGTAESLTRDATKTGVSTWAKVTGAFANTFKHYQGVFTVGPQGGTLVATQVLEFMVKINHGLAEGVIPTGTSNSGLAQAEPLSDGLSEVTVDFRVYKHDSDLYKGWQTGDTKISAKMEYTRGSEFLGFYMPLLQVVNAQVEPGEGGTVLVSCRAMLPTATDPFTTERTVSATEWVLPFSTPFYAIAKEASQVNFLRTT